MLPLVVVVLLAAQTATPPPATSPSAPAPSTTPAPSTPSPESTPTAPAPAVVEQAVGELAVDPRKIVHVAVNEFSARDVDPIVARVVMGALVTEMRKLQGLAVLSTDEVKAMIAQAADQALLGCDDNACLSELAEAIGADVIVIGSITRVGTEHVFGMRRINQSLGRVDGSVDRRLPAGSGEELLAIVGESVQALFPERELRPGKERGVDKELARRLNPPPLKPWVFWASAGASTAALAGTAAVSAFAIFAQEDYRALVREGSVVTIEGAQLRQKGQVLELAALSTNVMFATSALLVASTGVVALFVDWDAERGAP